MQLRINIQVTNADVWRRVYPRPSLKRHLTKEDWKLIGKRLCDEWGDLLPYGESMQVILTDNTGWNIHEIKNVRLAKQ